jgi:hypothetical protein
MELEEHIEEEVIVEEEIKPPVNNNPAFSNPQPHSTSTHYTSVSVYRLLMDAYLGEGLFSCNPEEDTAITYSRGELLYKERVMRSYYLNFLQPFVDAKYKPVYNEQPPTTTVKVGDSELSGEEHHYTQWLDNVDGAGLDYNQYKMNALQSGYLNAVSYMIMDKPDEPNAKPVLYMQSAASVDPRTIAVDDWGRLTKIGFMSEEVDENGKEYYRRVVWSDEEVVEEKATDPKSEKWTFVKRRPISVSKMPVEPVFTVQRNNPRDYLPTPVESRSVAISCSVLFNIISERIWHMVRQALAHIYTTGELDLLRDGNTSMVKLQNNGDGSTPQIGYINADTGIAKNHKELEDDMIQKIIDKMAEGGVVVTRGDMVVPESGVARSYRYRAQNAVYGQTVRISKRIDEWVEEMYKEYQGGGEWTSETRYKTDYTIKEPVSLMDLRDQINLYDRYRVDSLVKETLKEMITQTVSDGKKAEELVAEISDLKVEFGNGLDTFNE